MVDIKVFCSKCGKEMKRINDNTYICFKCSEGVVISEPSGAKKGWICPKCGRALAPWKKECDCYKYSHYINATATNQSDATQANTCITVLNRQEK